MSLALRAILQKRLNEYLTFQKSEFAIFREEVRIFQYDIGTMENRTCLSCGTKIFGRSDKKFCSDYCRNSYNNSSNKDPNNFVRRINYILRKNRKILAQLNPKGKAKVPRDKLFELGFNFNYYTNRYITKSGNDYHFVYDYGYLELDNDMFALVYRQEYVK